MMSFEQLYNNIVAGQLLHSLVITNPDLFCHLTNESHVMTNKHYATVEIIDGVGECVNGLHVEMVCEKATMFYWNRKKSE